MNEKNLIPLNKRTKSEQREITQKGGKASGVARGFRAAAKKRIRENPGEVDEVLDAIRDKALSGDMNAARLYVELHGEKYDDLDKKLKKAQIEKIKAETEAIRRRGDNGAPPAEAELPMLYHALTQTGEEDETEDDGDDV